MRGDDGRRVRRRHRARPPRLRRPHARRRRGYALADVTLLAPVPRPRAIFGIGRNYAAHAAETGTEPPEQPIVFLKLPTLERARPAARSGARGRVAAARLRGRARASSSAPGGAIAGYAVADDVSARDLQRRETQWTRAKGFDTLCPWGPWITTADEVPDAAGAADRHARSTARCARTRNTADLIFGPQALVDFIAETITLEPGDSSSPARRAGVGAGDRTRRASCSRGDVVRSRSRASARSSTTIGAMRERSVLVR